METKLLGNINREKKYSVRTILPFIDDLTGSRDIAAIVATGFSVMCEIKKNKIKA